MAESVSFKAYLKRDGQEVEVRRFGVDPGAATNFMYLRGKILAMFPSIQNDQFKIFWQDSDKDYVTVSSDEELVEALTSANVQPFKLFVNITAQEPNIQGGNGQSQPQTHLGITCDGCEGVVSGFRYKCVTCPDYDLCSACEAAGSHANHFMLRVPWPIEAGLHPKFVRKFLGCPHKFRKFARHCGQSNGFFPGPSMGGANQPGPNAGRCPFSRSTGTTNPTSSPPSAGLANMFDFSALMDFITSLETSATTEEPTAQPQTAPETQAPRPNQTSESQRRPRPPGAEYLTNIGQAISAFLDPFGIDVTVDVRPPEASRASPQPTVPTTSAETGPTTSSSSSTTPVSESTFATAASAPEKQPENLLQEPSPTSARRNSDDWTLLNGESPTHNEAVTVAMDVEESRGSKAQTPQPVETPTAPPPQAQLDSEAERDRQKLQEALDTIRAMGFNNDSRLLQQMIREENFNVLSVLEKILNSMKK